jgi:hypothetical protein
VPNKRREIFVCTKCNTEKTESEFYKRKTRNNRPSSRCKRCLYDDQRGYVRNRKYKISESVYETLSINGCNICGSISDKRLNIDHDHLSGIVRGVLCSRCNLTLGNVKDDISILEKMIEYLRRN